jgi:predicted negative regulator of RcsB-dependent stress response
LNELRMSKPRNPSSQRRAEGKKEAEDVFVDKTLEVVKWAKDHGQALFLAGIAIVVLVAGFLYYRNYRTSWEDQAVARLEQVQASFAAGDREAAKAELNQYVEQFEGTVYALEARLILGHSHLEDAEPDQAIEALAPAVREMNSQPIGIQAAFLMAAAYEESGQADEAERLFLRIANTSDLTFQVREALAGAARIRVNAGNLPGAAELYQDVLSDMEEGDPQRAFWEMRLAEVSG